MRTGFLGAALAAMAVVTGCRGPAEAERASSAEDTFAVEMKDSTGKPVAQGWLSLPRDIEESKGFRGACAIKVLDIPAQPSTQQDYAFRCLSQTNGKLSGRLKNGSIRIALQPETEDNTVYLEGQLAKQTFKGKWYYQSYAGYQECGPFDANVAARKTP